MSMKTVYLGFAKAINHFLEQDGDKIDKLFLYQKQTSWVYFGIGVAQTKMG